MDYAEQGRQMRLPLVLVLQKLADCKECMSSISLD